AIEVLALGRHGVRIGVHVVQSIRRRHLHAVRSLLARDAPEAAACSRDAVEMPLEGALLGGDKIDGALSFIHTGERSHFPGAGRELLEQFAAEVIEIDVPETITLA